MISASVPAGRRARWRRSLPLLIVITVAAFLRLSHLDLIEFKSDEATAFNLTEDFARSGAVPATGMGSSTGVTNGPMLIYLLRAAFVFGRDPRWLSAFVALTNVLATVLTYYLVAGWMGRRAGFVAAVALAVSPWAVLFSRKIWAQDLLLIFVVLLLLALDRAARRDRSRTVAAVPILLSVLWQLHYLAYAVFVATALTLPVSPGVRRLSWRWLGCGAAIGAAIAEPFLHHLYVSGFADVGRTAAFLHETAAGRHEPSSAADIVRVAAVVAGGRNLEASFGASFAPFLAAHPCAAHAAGFAQVAMWALIVFGALLLAVRVVWPRILGFSPNVDGRDVTPWLAAIWIAGPALVCCAFHLHVAPCYFIVTFPLLFALFAAGAEGLFAAARRAPYGCARAAQATVWLAIAAVAIGQIVFVLGCFSFLDGNGGARGDYGVTYRHKAAAARFIVSQSTPGRPPSFALRGFGGEGIGCLIDLESRKLALGRSSSDGSIPPPETSPVFEIYDRFADGLPVDPPCSARRDFGPLIVCRK
jgi:hypothetical protein